LEGYSKPTLTYLRIGSWKFLKNKKIIGIEIAHTLEILEPKVSPIFYK
jgi:hypothetical protein